MCIPSMKETGPREAQHTISNISRATDSSNTNHRIMIGKVPTKPHTPFHSSRMRTNSSKAPMIKVDSSSIEEKEITMQAPIAQECRRRRISQITKPRARIRTWDNLGGTCKAWTTWLTLQARTINKRNRLDPRMLHIHLNPSIRPGQLPLLIECHLQCQLLRCINMEAQIALMTPPWLARNLPVPQLKP